MSGQWSNYMNMSEENFYRAEFLYEQSLKIQKSCIFYFSPGAYVVKMGSREHEC